MTSMTARGQLLPLAVPLHTPQLRQLRSLRTQANELANKIAQLTQLQEQLGELSNQSQWDAIIPVGSNSGLGYARGSITHTKTVLVHYESAAEVPDGLLDKAEKRQSGYWVEYTPEQAREAATRRQACLRPKLEQLTASIAETEELLSSQMGFSGGHLNEKFELINEEGLPFVEIQEIEEDDDIPIKSSPQHRNAPKSTSHASVPPSTSLATSQAADQGANRKLKKVSFADSTDTSTVIEDLDSSKVHNEEALPLIASEKAAISAGIGPATSGKTTEVSSSQKIDEIPSTEDAIKPTIVERDTTKPPPILTAAERSARKKTKWDVITEFDGIEPRKVDLSAYLPRQLRGHAISKTFKVSDPSKEVPFSTTNDTESSHHEDDLAGNSIYDPDYDHDDDDSDGYSFDDEAGDDDEESDDNAHIDDILAMREASMEYHARRHALGAGAGTGPLGGFGGQDDFDEPGPSEIDKGGLPFVETYDETDGQRRPSRFRKSRLETAHMVIPQMKPGDVEINENLLPGDSLGPFEDEETTEAGEHGTNDFKGMSKEEIETFLRYVKALETGEDLEDLRIVAGATDSTSAKTHPFTSGLTSAPGPPVVKATTSAVPSIRSNVVEKVDGVANVEDTLSAKNEAPGTADPQVEDGKPKRVSRFRAARSGGA